MPSLPPVAPYGSAPPLANAYGAPLPPAPKRRGLPSWAIAVISVVGIGGLAAAVLAAQSSSADKAEVEFDEDFREEFIDGCLGAGPAATRDVCGCYYDELVKRMSAEEMIRLGLDDSADAGDDPRVMAAVEQCI